MTITAERVEELSNKLKLKLMEYDRNGIQYLAVSCKDVFDTLVALERLKEYEKLLGCQHDLLRPGHTIDVHGDGAGGTCRKCGHTWRTAS